MCTLLLLWARLQPDCVAICPGAAKTKEVSDVCQVKLAGALEQASDNYNYLYHTDVTYLSSFVASNSKLELSRVQPKHSISVIWSVVFTNMYLNNARTEQ